MITKPWDNGIVTAKQERISDPMHCYFKPLIEDDNEWYFVDLKERKETDKEDMEENRKDVLEHVTNYVSATVEIGNIG